MQPYSSSAGLPCWYFWWMESCIISHDSGTYGVDIPKNVWHGLECLEPSVLLECKEGPFIEHEVDGILEIKKIKYRL